jgi:hypothetical protein
MNSFNLLKKVGKVFSGTCRYYVGERYKCDRKVTKKGDSVNVFWQPILVPNLEKMQSKIHSKIDREKTWKMKPKRSRNGVEIDAKTHQKSMPELVSEKIKKIMKIHVSLKSKIIEIHWKNDGF